MEHGKYIHIRQKFTVKDLIELLKQYPEDLPVAVNYTIQDLDGEPYSEIDVRECRWEPTNYPYTGEEFDYLNLE